MTVSKSAITGLHASMHECLDLILDHASSMPPILLANELPGFGHPSVLEQIAHVLSAEAGWVRRLQSLPLERVTAATLDELRKVKNDVMAATAAYLNGISESEMNAELAHYPEEWVGPRRAPAFILLHIITHAFHHKGQIVAMLRLLGHPAPDTDMQQG